MLAYRRYGSGKPVILQHGFLGGSGYWEPQLATLGHHFDLIAPDLPGFANSGHMSPPDSIPGFAQSLVELMDRLGVESIDFVGHSMGSMVALQFALDFPDRLNRLVLYGSAASGNLPDRFESIEATIDRIRADGIDTTAERVVATWFVAGATAPFASLCRDAGRGVTVESAVRSLRAIAKWTVADRLAEISTPTLLICGDRDRSTPVEQSLSLWRTLPNAQLCIVPGCAHNVHLEKADLFSTIVLNFLSPTSSAK